MCVSVCVMGMGVCVSLCVWWVCMRVGVLAFVCVCVHVNSLICGGQWIVCLEHLKGCYFYCFLHTFTHYITSPFVR